MVIYRLREAQDWELTHVKAQLHREQRDAVKWQERAQVNAKDAHLSHKNMKIFEEKANSMTAEKKQLKATVKGTFYRQ